MPYLFEAREFLRKRLIGKKVNVTVDYVRPPNNGYPERICASVFLGNQNLQEAIVSKGMCDRETERETETETEVDNCTMISTFTCNVILRNF